jgi:hypothetical protein
LKHVRQICAQEKERRWGLERRYVTVSTRQAFKYESAGFRRVTAIRPVYLQYLLLQGVDVLWQASDRSRAVEAQWRRR